MCSQEHPGKSNHNDYYNRNHHNTLYAFLKATRKRSGRVTLEQVAELTGVSRQALYNHYSDIRSAEFQGVGEMLTDFESQFDKKDWKYSKMIPDSNKPPRSALASNWSSSSKLFERKGWHVYFHDS